MSIKKLYALMTFKETEFFIFVVLRAGKINKPLGLDRVFMVEVLSLIKNFKGDSFLSCRKIS